jgi:hypothetical protein
LAGVRPAAPRYGFSNKAVALRPCSEKLPGSPIFHQRLLVLLGRKSKQDRRLRQNLGNGP